MDFLIAIEIMVVESWLQTKEGAFFASQDTMGVSKTVSSRSEFFDLISLFFRHYQDEINLPLTGPV